MCFLCFFVVNYKTTNRLFDRTQDDSADTQCPQAAQRKQVKSACILTNNNEYIQNHQILWVKGCPCIHTTTNCKLNVYYQPRCPISVFSDLVYFLGKEKF